MSEQENEPFDAEAFVQRMNERTAERRKQIGHKPGGDAVLSVAVARYMVGVNDPRHEPYLTTIEQLISAYDAQAAALAAAEARNRELLEQLRPGSATERAPTQWAYEQVCAALESHRQRAAAAEAEVARLRGELQEAADECKALDEEAHGLRVQLWRGSDWVSTVVRRPDCSRIHPRTGHQVSPPVLVLIEGKPSHEAHYYRKDAWFSEHGAFPVYGVTHWQPWPAAPQQEGREG